MLYKSHYLVFAKVMKYFPHFQAEWLRHVIFWSGLYACFVFFGLNEHEKKILIFLEEGINTMAFAGIVYFNFYLLIPLFLSRKKILAYIGSLLLFLAFLAPILSSLLKMLYRSFEEPVNVPSTDMRSIFMATALVALFSTIFQVLSEWFRHERDRKELEQQKSQSELRFLKSQINPHFLFNTLNSLYALTLKKSDDAPEIVLKLSDMMRYMLYECNEKTVPLEKEVRYIRNYLDLEKIRQGGHVDIQFEVLGTLDHEKIAPLLLIPFIENSFKHGVSRQLKDAFVHLKIIIEDQSLVMKLNNSKPELTLSESLLKTDGGIGLANVRHQLKLLYPKNHLLKIEESPFDYHVYLKINL